MISGARSAACAVLACAGLALPASGGSAAEWGLEQLMHELAQVKSARARFVERRDVGLLNEPLESEGTLFYEAPARLEKHTLKPREESLVLQGDRLTWENRTRRQVRTFSLQDNPVIWAFTESIRATLAGDLKALQRLHEVRLEGVRRQWRLTLVPRDAAMRQHVSEIHITGSGAHLGAVDVIERLGDRSHMTISRDVP